MVRDRSVAILPELVFAIHKMTCDEREENRVAPAHFQDLGPVGVVGPGDDLAPLVLPAQNARAVIGGDKDFIFIVRDLERRLVLEKEGAFHMMIWYAC